MCNLDFDDLKRELLKKELCFINQQRINIQRMYEKKTGLPWSFLESKKLQKKIYY